MPERGSGAITVFAGSRATVSRSTLTGNWSGVDDEGTGSTYVDTIFWKNTLAGGISPGRATSWTSMDGAGVRGSFIHGAVGDCRERSSGTPTPSIRPIPASTPQFVPQAAEYSKVGYRPRR